MNWMVVSDVWIAGTLLIVAFLPVVTRKPMRYLIPFKGSYDAKPAMQLILQLLYLGIAGYLVIDAVFILHGKR
jgi:hypothetical protein